MVLELSEFNLKGYLKLSRVNYFLMDLHPFKNNTDNVAQIEQIMLHF